MLESLQIKSPHDLIIKFSWCIMSDFEKVIPLLQDNAPDNTSLLPDESYEWEYGYMEGDVFENDFTGIGGTLI